MRGYFTDLAARGTHQVHIHAAPGVERQSAAHAEGLIIRMGQDGQYSSLLFVV
jgi:hypothetical protein